MSAAMSGWEFDLERGPGWLLIHVRCPGPRHSDYPPLATRVWSELERHITYRLVLEFDGAPHLNLYLIRQLIELDKHIHDHGGIMRLCGLSPKDWTNLQERGLRNRFPTYLNRRDAVFARARSAMRDDPDPLLSSANTKRDVEEVLDEPARHTSRPSRRRRARGVRTKETVEHLVAAEGYLV